MKKVSVIIPVYNGEQYIMHCYKNVRRQTLQEIEFIFVDNGSDDRSNDILQDLSKQDKDMKVCIERVRGAGPARNTGMKAAEGEFLFFFDVDDELPNEHSLEVLYRTARRENAAICGGRFLRFVDGMLDEESTSKYPCNPLLEKHGEGRVEYYDYQFDGGYQNFLFSATLLRSNDIWFPAYLRYQDPPFLVKSMLAAKWFYLCDIDTYAYMCSSVKKTLNVKQILDVIHALRDELDIAHSYGLRKLAGYVMEHINGYYYRSQIVRCMDGAGRILIAELLSFEQELKEYFPDLYEQDNGLKALNRLFESPGLFEKRGDAIEKKRIEIQKLKQHFEYAKEVVERKQWIFPTEKIPKDSAIVIWGAGDVGQDLYRQAVNFEYCDVVAWVDKNFQNIDDSRIKDPNIVGQLDYDYILIASCQKRIVDLIEQELEEMKIPAHKIITIEGVLTQEK